MRKLLRSALAASGIALACWTLPATLDWPKPVIRNSGLSMPRGFWRYAHAAPPEVGEVVVLRDPPGFRLDWLMKRVAGVGGAHYCWHPDLGTHTLDGRPMPAPWARAAEYGVKPWSGCRTLAEDEVIGYGESPDSYDSRFIGPVRLDQIRGVYKPLWLVE